MAGWGSAPVLETCAVCSGERCGAAVDAVEFRWDPDRGGAVCAVCGQRGRPIRTIVRQTLARLRRTPLETATAQPLSQDVNRGCREALAEVVKLHITGTLHSVEFIAKLGGHV